MTRKRKKSQPQQDTSEVDASFQQAFGPLAHHLFPDGPPSLWFKVKISDKDDEDSWPISTSRAAVSAKDAKVAISKTKQYARLHGLNCAEQWAVTLAACATVDYSCDVKSPLMDRSFNAFCALIKCLIPSQENVHVQAVLKLLSVTAKCNSLGKATVLRWITLVIRNANLVDDKKDITNPREQLSSCYNVIFYMLRDPHVTPDAVRLLYALTRHRHVKVYRAKRLLELYNSQTFEAHGHSKACLLLLLQLYAAYDPRGCGLIPTKKSKANRLVASAYSNCFKIPNEVWEREILGDYFVQKDGHTGDNTDRAQESTAKRARILSSSDEPQKMGTISSTLDWLEHALEGGAHSRMRESVTTQRRQVVRASTILMDPTVQHLVVLSCVKNSVREVRKLRASLPYMLYEEWYFHHLNARAKTHHKDDDEDSSASSSDASDEDENEGNASQDDNWLLDDVVSGVQRQDASLLSCYQERVLEGLACMALHGQLLPEMEAFVIDEVLPKWDGTMEVMGKCLCYDLLPVLSPRTFGDLQSSVLVYLSPLLLYGPPRLQYAILSGALAALLRKWGRRLQWSPSKQKRKYTEKQSDRANTQKERTLRELIQWTQEHILKIIVGDGGHELVCLAALDFFTAVVELSEDSKLFVTPNPFLIYRLLLSKSALSTNGTCQLLVSYRNAFVKLKSELDKNQQQDTIEGLDRIVVLNSFIWDFCSVLYKFSPVSSMTSSKSILFTDISKQALSLLHARENQEELSTALGITHGAAFCGYAQEYLTEQQLPQDRLRRTKTKARCLEYLSNNVGLKGLNTFLSSFVSSLAKQKQSAAESKQD